ncbi:MAG TPA: thioredoxin domain-containing protein [Blastocatellia bacterium]|nr:thioredoxin domain-containing protein [Blastocatellia bacterium]
MRRVSLILAIGVMISAVTAQPGAAFPYGRQDPKAGRGVAMQSVPAEPSKPADKKEADCGCEAKAPPDVLATVNGANVEIKDVDEPIKDRVRELQNQVIEARKRQLDVEINARLLEAEAARLGTTADKLLEREVAQKLKQPTEADAQAFYGQNKSRIQGEFKDLKDQIISYIHNQRQEQEAKKFADRLRIRGQVKMLVESVTPPETEADRARVFATVNGKRITSGDVEDALKPLIFSVQEQVYTLRKQALDTKINDLLLEGEAKKRNVTAAALFDSEVLPRVKPVTEDEARKLYEENKARVQGTFDELRPQVIQYLQSQAQAKAAEEYAEQLRKGATVRVFLKQPDPPVFDIAIVDSPWKGGANAPVTIVEFTDYECPSCAATQPVLEEVAREFGDKVKLVVRSFPLGQHTHAFKASEASEAAREQGKFWEYAALLFTNQKALQVDKLKEYASQLGLDRKKFDAALDSGRFSGRVKRDLADGERIGVDSTPSVFINGKRARERTKEALKAAVEAALKETAKK